MGEFQRETASWLFEQPFWLQMSTCQKESWLEYREGVALQYEDILRILDMERANMEQQDIVEMSRYRWVDLNHEERQSLQEYQRTWEVLGGGQIVAARFANKTQCIESWQHDSQTRKTEKGNATDDKKQEKTSNIRKAADEFCSTRHLGQKLGNVNSGPLLIEIAGFLGFPGRDRSWVTTWGEDVTYLCDQSDSGGFHGHHWTMAGWVLDNVSIEALLQEFPNSLHT